MPITILFVDMDCIAMSQRLTWDSSGIFHFISFFPSNRPNIMHMTVLANSSAKMYCFCKMRPDIKI